MHNVAILAFALSAVAGLLTSFIQHFELISSVFLLFHVGSFFVGFSCIATSYSSHAVLTYSPYIFSFLLHCPTLHSVALRSWNVSSVVLRVAPSCRALRSVAVHVSYV